MKRLLFVSAFTPERIARHAGGRVAHENLENWRAQGYEVDVVVCTTEAEPATDPSFIIVRQDWAKFARWMLANLGWLSLRSIVTAPILHTRLNTQFQRVLIEHLATHGYERIHVEYTQALFFVLLCLKRAGGRVPVLVCLQDLFVQRMLRSRSLFKTLLSGLVMKEEQALLAQADEILVLSAKDESLLRNLYNLGAPIKVKPFTAPDWCRKVVRAADAAASGRLLFFANFERPENAGAARWFVEGPWPEVRRRVASATLTLAGTGSDRLAQRLAGAGVSGTGFVEDPSELYAHCSCAIAPLTEGAGVKFKVLEALACGVPVIGTPVAFEGIAPTDLMVQAGPEEFGARTAAFLLRA
jgi:glycosyltransferase involved in cell wall biosynthesis